MKLFLFAMMGGCGSRPRKGAWIEITILPRHPLQTSRRPRKGAWIEIAARTWR